MFASHVTPPPPRSPEIQEVIMAFPSPPAGLTGYRMPQFSESPKRPVRGGSLVVGNLRLETILADLRLILNTPVVADKFVIPLREYRLFSILTDREEKLLSSNKFWKIVNEDPQWLEFAGILLGGHALAHGVKNYLLTDPFLDPRVSTAWLRALFSYENYRCKKAACSRETAEDGGASRFFCLPFRTRQEVKNDKKLEIQNLIDKFLWSHQATVQRARLPFDLQLSIGTCVDNYRYAVIDKEFVQQTGDIEATLQDVQRSTSVLRALTEQISRAQARLSEFRADQSGDSETILALRLADIEFELLPEVVHREGLVRRKPEFIKALESVLPPHLVHHRENLSVQEIDSFFAAGREKLENMWVTARVFQEQTLETLQCENLQSLFSLHASIIDLIKLHFIQDTLPERLEQELGQTVAPADIEQRRAELRGPLIGHYLTDTQLSLLTKVGMDAHSALKLQQKAVWNQGDRDLLATNLIHIAPYWHSEMREYLAGMLLNSYGPFFYDDWPLLPPRE